MKFMRTIAVISPIFFCSFSYFLWGFPTHQMIAEKAAENLPDSPFKAFALENRQLLKEQAIYPDQRRDNDPLEGPNHYIDFEMYGIHDHKAKEFENGFPEPKGLVEGKQESYVKGRVPWRIEELYDRLVVEMRTGGWEQAKRTMGEMCHYLADATMPLHTTENYDGQLSGQKGVHGRLEMEVVDPRVAILASSLKLPEPVRPLDAGARKAAIWQVLRESFSQVSAVLEADKALLPWKGAEEQKEAFWRSQREIIERKMGRAVWITASFWQSAWVDAGKPEPLLLNDPEGGEVVAEILNAKQTKDFGGKQATVEFLVVKVSHSEASNRWFLNSHDPYKGHFSVTVYPEVKEELEKKLGGALREKLQGKTIQVKGQIRLRNDTPEMKLRNAEDLKLR